MRKELIENAAYEIVTQTRAVEDIIEAALTELTELQARVIRISNVAGVSYSTLQESFERVAATTSELVKARGAMAECHVAFAEAKEHIPGLRTVAWGDCDIAYAETPPVATPLRVVA
jgi:hypothetical protein